MFIMDNYDKSLQYFIDDQLFFELDPNLSKKANFYISQQSAELQDEVMQLGQLTQL
jgi:hypothetical protein